MGKEAGRVCRTRGERGRNARGEVKNEMKKKGKEWKSRIV